MLSWQIDSNENSVQGTHACVQVWLQLVHHQLYFKFRPEALHMPRAGHPNTADETLYKVMHEPESHVLLGTLESHCKRSSDLNKQK